MEIPTADDKNADQIAYWNGPGGQRWADRQQAQDILLRRRDLDRDRLRRLDPEVAFALSRNCGGRFSSHLAVTLLPQFPGQEQSSLLYICLGTNSDLRRDVFGQRLGDKSHDRQADQVPVGGRHGGSLSRCRSCRRKRLGRDGVSYRLYVRGRGGFRGRVGEIS
jgi:hypothetical protein